MGALAVGHPDGRAGQPPGRAVDEDDRHPAIELRLQERVVPAAGHDHQRVDRPGQQPVHQVLLAVGVGVGADREDQAALLAGDPFDRPVQHRGERVADVLQDQADRRGPAVRPAQRVRGVVAPVAQLAGRREHPLPGLRRRADLVVDHPGHRFQADPGRPRDVVHGGSAQPVSHRTVPFRWSSGIPSVVRAGSRAARSARRRSPRFPRHAEDLTSGHPHGDSGRPCRHPRGGATARRPVLVHNLAMQPAPAHIHAEAEQDLAGGAGAPAGAVRAAAGPLVERPARRAVRGVRRRPGRRPGTAAGADGGGRLSGARPRTAPAGPAAHAGPGLVPGRVDARLRRLRGAVRRRPRRDQPTRSTTCTNSASATCT